MKAMMLAAGLGTRLKPFTDYHPKALAPVHGKPVLHWNIDYLYQAGVRDFIINVHHFAEQIIEFVAQLHMPDCCFTISDERDAVLETGGGLKKAQGFFNDGASFILMNADILTDLPMQDFLNYHRSHKAMVSLAVSERKSSRCLLFNDKQQLCGWRNRDSGETKWSRSNEGTIQEMAFGGIHIIDPTFFRYLTQDGPFSIIDTYLEAANTANIMVYDHRAYKLLDIGKPESLLLAETMF
ncbi:MAG: nucleotidyltransferase family protein [Chitinophagaceae bacterium]|nr:nucleotidyltransferase family protein [Chitinophagaceae bacterium]